jgi:hypothetical protein
MAVVIKCARVPSCDGDERYLAPDDDPDDLLAV